VTGAVPACATLCSNVEHKVAVSEARPWTFQGWAYHESQSQGCCLAGFKGTAWHCMDSLALCKLYTSCM